MNILLKKILFSDLQRIRKRLFSKNFTVLITCGAYMRLLLKYLHSGTWWWRRTFDWTCKLMHLCRWPLPWLVWLLFKAKYTGDSKIPVHGAWFFKLVLRWSHELFHDNNEHNPLSYKLKFRRRAVVPSRIEVYICSEANFALNQLKINKLFSYIF